MKKIKLFCCQDPFEPVDDMLYIYHRNELAGALREESNRNADVIIGYLKQTPLVHRWDLFCWVVQHYALSLASHSRLFKFAWLFGTPDERAVEIIRCYIKPDSLMDKSELDEISRLPEKVTVYKAVPAKDMQLAEDEAEDEWASEFDWKWSLDLGKITYIASILGEGYIVISTVIPRSKIMALFHGVEFSYELIAEGNCGMFNEYKIEVERPERTNIQADKDLSILIKTRLWEM